MLMNPPPGDAYSVDSINRQSTQALSTPGLQRHPVLGQNLSGMPGSQAMAPGMPQLSPNPIDPRKQQMAMMVKMLAGGGHI
jgi:hypothetical protein